MRVRDNGPGARVIATLKRVTLNYFGDGPQRSDVAATIDGDAISTERRVDHCQLRRAPAIQQQLLLDKGSPDWHREEMNFFDAGWFVEYSSSRTVRKAIPGC